MQERSLCASAWYLRFLVMSEAKKGWTIAPTGRLLTGMISFVGPVLRLQVLVAYNSFGGCCRRVMVLGQHVDTVVHCTENEFAGVSRSSGIIAAISAL